jgi:hypothetical protein
MGIKNHIFHIVISKKIIPQVCVKLECIVERKDDAGIHRVDNVPCFSVEVLQYPHVRIPPGLVYWLKGIHSWMLTVLFHKFLDVVECPVHTMLIICVDVVVLIGREVERSHPVSCFNWPVAEVIFIGPFKV